jgi:hypothetical protein
MSGKVNDPDVEAGHAESLALVHAIVALCDGHDTAAVLAALHTVCVISLCDIGLDVELFVHRLRIDSASTPRRSSASSGRARRPTRPDRCARGRFSIRRAYYRMAVTGRAAIRPGRVGDLANLPAPTVPLEISSRRRLPR